MQVESEAKLFVKSLRVAAAHFHNTVDMSGANFLRSLSIPLVIYPAVARRYTAHALLPFICACVLERALLVGCVHDKTMKHLVGMFTRRTLRLQEFC